VDLGITGKKAIVCGSSAGLGFACAEALVREGVTAVLVARDPVRLAAAAKSIERTTGIEPKTVAADVTLSEGRAVILRALPDPDILVTNCGGPPKRDFREVSLDEWRTALEANFLVAVEMIRLTINGMTAKRWGRVVNISSVTARSPIEQMDQSTAARLALAGYVAGVARQVAPTGVTINNLLPGLFATDRLSHLGSLQNELVARVPMHRIGDPPEFGATCAFLCSRQAAYITGQNVLIDGGMANITI
jgi:3-oxoacyl-[acyl-carrier protein] reductase